MTSMFTRLYLYRERAEVSPLENFLTEVLAEMFRRLPNEKRHSLVLALVPPGDRADLSEVLADKEILVETQVSIPVSGLSKRPDIVLRLSGRSLIVIEAKVGASITEHDIVESESALGETRFVQHQLRTYAEWIVSENKSDNKWPGAITLLTAHAAPPSDFVEGRHGGAASSIRSWKDIGDWIVKEIAIADRNTTYCAIAHELYLFLKERKLMTNSMSARDIAAAALYTPSAANFKNTFADVIKAVGKNFEKLKGARQIKDGFWSEANVYWTWFHFARTLKRKKSKPYVAIGICFEISEPWIANEAMLPRSEPFFFVSCADDWAAEMPSQFLTDIPVGWSKMEEDWTICVTRPVSQFPADPDARMEELKTWAIGHVQQLVACIQDYEVAPVEASAPDADEDTEA